MVRVRPQMPPGEAVRQRRKKGRKERRKTANPWELRMSKSNLSPHILSTVLTEEEFVSLLTTPKDI